MGKVQLIPQRKEKFFPVTTGKREERSARFLKLGFGAASKGPSS